MFKKILGKFLDSNEKEIRRLWPIVEKVNTFEKEFEKLDAGKLADKTAEFKARLENGESLDDILPEAFAAVREASKRTTGLFHFNVQLLSGIVLHLGKIAEQKTGEGKTLSATLPLYLNSLTGRGCHLVTVNDYLARRDAEWMGPIYGMLGISVGVLNHEKSYLFDFETWVKNRAAGTALRQSVATQRREASGDARQISNIKNQKFVELGTGKFLREVFRKEAYAADITYGTNNEFGFDYLRDNMVWDTNQMAQRGHHFAIVDEVDSLLIDEARTPLIISAPGEEPTEKYYKFSKLVERLSSDTDYTVDEKLKTANLTEHGIAKIEKWLGVPNLYEKDFSTIHHIEQALKAKTLFFKERDYIVKDDEVIIVDEFTGRLMFGRRYSEGLHQAIEAKEGVPIKQESKTLATISFQNYFRMYEKLAGMTGTAATEAEEFHKIYKLDVVMIPTHNPMVRADRSDVIYKTAKAKYQAIAKEIEECHKRGQPVLVGTTSIDKNELIAELLKRKGVVHQILNAKHHEKEAQIIAQAGHLGQVTVATNMAGRGVDIILGGNPPSEKEQKKVIELGGLHVIGTERHEARRIDNQLRGRAGRQGDPGSSRFYVALEDDIMRLFGGEQVARLMTAFKFPEDQPLEHPMVSKAIEQAQIKVEGHNFDLRKHLVEYDDVMNKQREIIYGLRKKILEQNEGLREETLEKVDKEITNFVLIHTQENGEVDYGKIISELATIVPFDEPSQEQIKSQISSLKSTEEITNFVTDLARKVYEGREKQLGPDVSRQIEKFVTLSVIDNLWMEHLDAVDDLREGIGLRGYGQRDPLVEYKAEAYSMFEKLVGNIDYEITRRIYKITVQQQTPQPPRQVVASQGGSQTVDQTPIVKNQKPGRNDPCPCGSGKKYKKCHYPQYG